MSFTLNEMLEQLSGVSDDQRQDIIETAKGATKDLKWVPNPGPQMEAYFCEADELFYGGQAGGGKTDLALGLALNEHERSLILRRTNKEARGLVERMAEILGSRTGYNSQDGAWRRGKQFIELGGCEHEEDKQKYKGRAHDLKAFDEVSDFTESQYLFITTWNRSTTPGQRTRVVATGNPPTTAEGLWVVRRWAAWLDPQHPNPARPGELRWYTTGEDGQEIEVDNRGPHWINGEEVYARSRTFIPAKLSDNPDLQETDYGSVLAGLPPELRDAYRDGKFTTIMTDDQWQCIPTTWVQAAQARWQPNQPTGVPLCAIGVDVAQGGKDSTVLARRYNGWFAPLVVIPGVKTPDGPTVAAEVIKYRRDDAVVIVDLGGGWGGEAYAHLKQNGINCKGYMGVKASEKRTADQTLKFSNVRTEAYWRFREALNPAQEGGSFVQLPPSNKLLAELCAPRFKVTGQAGKGGVVSLESKEDVVKRLGYSPDEADAIIMAWWKGITHVNIPGGNFGAQTKRPSTAVMSSNRPRRSQSRRR